MNLQNHKYNLLERVNEIPILLVLIGLTIALSSCQYLNEEELSTNCETDNISLAGNILPMIQMECATAGCHVTGTGRMVLTDYNQLKIVADDGRLRHMVITTRNMPPTKSLDPCQIEELRAWIDQGALDN